MTSTSFRPSQPGCHELFVNTRDGDPSVSQDDTTPERLISLDVHAVEARRMRAFANQRRFQAPVAQDFVNGMSASDQPLSEDPKPFEHFRLINSLTTWWRR